MPAGQPVGLPPSMPQGEWTAAVPGARHGWVLVQSSNPRTGCAAALRFGRGESTDSEGCAPSMYVRSGDLLGMVACWPFGRKVLFVYLT